MTILRLIGEPKSKMSQWLKDHFDGEATMKEFTENVNRDYLTRNGRRIPIKNVYARVLRDERRGIVVREADSESSKRPIEPI